jgi:AcrR family transcriptional regulator
MAADAFTDVPPRTTWRTQQKSDRSKQLLRAAAHLLAERGYLGVRLEDLGAAVGISGPAIYRHFANKEAVLVELLTDISHRLLIGATQVTARIADPRHALAELIDFHLDFALNEPDLIRIQDRDLANLPPAALRNVRRTQRQYVEIWAATLRRIDPDLSEADAGVKAHAAFGLINSTSHSTHSYPTARTRATLRRMTLDALGLGQQPRRGVRKATRAGRIG